MIRVLPYASTPVMALRDICGLRNIHGMPRAKKGEALAAALTALDVVLKRASPFWADVEDKLAGENCCMVGA